MFSRFGVIGCSNNIRTHIYLKRRKRKRMERVEAGLRFEETDRIETSV